MAAQRSSSACKACRRKKVKCTVHPGANACQRCVDKELECNFWTPAGGPTSPTRVQCSVACEACRSAKMACERDEGDPACARCVEEGLECHSPEPRGKTTADERHAQEDNKSETGTHHSGESRGESPSDDLPPEAGPSNVANGLTSDDLSGPSTLSIETSMATATIASRPTSPKSFWNVVLQQYPEPGSDEM
ncbi:hypothetical protein C8Q80DRAFT_702810 [Daedaleopsis nitida]|nr:hypothetical protein C8Q80DRAFT_702810 [Daedaleopsis nitida]